MNYEYCDGITHTIKKGDTLYEISRMHNVPLSLLLRANPYVDVFNLQIGDTLCIPTKQPPERPFPMPGLSPGPVLPEDVEPQMNTKQENAQSGQKIQSQNVSEDSKNEKKPETKEMKWTKYVVKPGDTLGDILQGTETDIEDFVKKNGISTIYMLPGVAYYVRMK